MRYANNPILTPRDLAPSQESMKIECLLNPGVFRVDGKAWLLIRVAERPEQREGEISFPLLDDANRITVMRVPSSSPELALSDPRVISYKGSDYRLKRSAETASHYTLGQIEACLQVLLELDQSLKSQPVEEQILLETALCRLAMAGSGR